MHQSMGYSCPFWAIPCLFDARFKVSQSDSCWEFLTRNNTLTSAFSLACDRALIAEPEPALAAVKSSIYNQETFNLWGVRFPNYAMLVVHHYVYARITLDAACSVVTSEAPPRCLALDKAVIGGKNAGRFADLHCYRMTKQVKGQNGHRRISPKNA